MTSVFFHISKNIDIKLAILQQIEYNIIKNGKEMKSTRKRGMFIVEILVKKKINHLRHVLF